MPDGVIQSLFGLGMSLQGLATSTALPVGVAERLNVVVDGIDAAIRDPRNYVFGLRPSLLADRELEGALRRLASDLAADSNVLVSIEIEPIVASLLSPVASEVVQISREALSNIRRHAGASNVRLVLSRTESRAVLEITDDGCVLEPSAARGEGLDNMHRRAERFGGELLIGPRDLERGTLVTLSAHR
jgi:signal transduction histidine kinase